MALDAAKKYRRHLYTLGPLIHNPQAVEFLETLGMKARDRIGFTAGGFDSLVDHQGSGKQSLAPKRAKGLKNLYFLGRCGI